MPVYNDEFTVKNSIELVENIMELKIKNKEILVSFDVCSFLRMSDVLINTAIGILEKWIDIVNINHLEKFALIEFTKLCMRQNYFEFRDNIYHQYKGLQ